MIEKTRLLNRINRMRKDAIRKGIGPRTLILWEGFKNCLYSGPDGIIVNISRIAFAEENERAFGLNIVWTNIEGKVEVV